MIKHWIRTCLFVLSLLLSSGVTAMAFRVPIAAAVERAQPVAEAEPVAAVVEQAVPVWRVCVRGSGLADLYSSQGDWLQQLDLCDGETRTEAMPPGDYCLLREDENFVSFRLKQNAAIEMLGGNGWSDGEILYLEDLPGGSVQVVCWLTPEEFDSGAHRICWLNLYGTEGIQSAALYFNAELEPEDNGMYCQCWSFQGLKPGTYVLEKDGQQTATITLTREQPDYMLVLGGGK